MSRDPVLQLVRDLVAIDSVNPTLVPGAPGEAQVADAIEATMRRIGLDVTRQWPAPGRPNVIGVLEGRMPGPTLMLCGHMDTVGVAGMAAPFDPVERDGRIYGRGSQDMKSGVAAMIDATRVIAEHGGLPRGRVIVAAVADEEHSSIGADALVAEWNADVGVVTEPTDLAIAVGHKGFAWVEVEVFGRAAHGSRPREGQDAILRMGRVLGQLERLDRRLQNDVPHALMGHGSLHASIIEGGREMSSYPDRALLRLERRTLPGDPESIALIEVTSILEGLAAEDATFSARASHMFSRPAYEVAENHPLPAQLAEVVSGLGRRASLVGASFWTDAAVMAHAGIPSVLFGPTGAGLHSIEEWVDASSVVFCRDALAELARRVCGA